MKKNTLRFLLLLLLLIATSIVGSGRGRFKTVGPIINNAGEFPFHKDSVKLFEFLFTNTGDSLYSIAEVIPTCPCMTVTWTREAVAPGDTGWIRVAYKADGPGHFRKMLTVLGDGFPEWDYIYVEGTAISPADGQSF